VLPRYLSSALRSKHRLDRWRSTHRAVSDQDPGFGPFVVGALLLAIFLTSSKGAAQDLFETWNLHGPQQDSEGRRGTWLDPLRSNHDSRAADNDREKITATKSRTNDDFDLSDFVHAARRSSTVRDSATSLVSQTQEFPSNNSEVTQSPPFYDPAFHDDSLPSGNAQHKRITPDAVFSDCPSTQNLCDTLQVLPKGLLYRTYLAGEKEPRLQFLHLYDLNNKQTVWEAVLGGRAGLLRYDTGPAEAFQLDLEGAVFARVLPSEPSAELAGSDYRVGVFGTWKFGQTAYKAGYYHISSHVGDEYLLANPTFNRINYVRDSLLVGISQDLSESTRIYGEIGYSAGYQGGAQPWELQGGAEYTPVAQSSFVGAPFVAVNGHLREEFNFGGGVNIASGWGWQGRETGNRLRIGLNYYYGPSLQWIFFDRRESLVGGGIWFDF